MLHPNTTNDTEDNLILGSTGEQVRRLHIFLRKFGYLPQKPHLASINPPSIVQISPKDDGVFDEATQMALKVFQRNHGLHVDGVLNRETRSLLQQPRCNVPDNSTFNPGPAPEFVLQGGKWSQTQVTYRLNNAALPGLTNQEIVSNFSQACGEWAAESGLTFELDVTSANVNIDVSFIHIDGSPPSINGNTNMNILGESTSPPSNVTMEFDNGNEWTLKTEKGKANFLCTVLHELGHAIGLGHSADKDSIMYAYYTGLTKLGEDDKSAAQFLYNQLDEKAIMLHNVSDQDCSYFIFNSDDGTKTTALKSGNLDMGVATTISMEDKGSYFVRFTDRGGGTAYAGCIVSSGKSVEFRYESDSGFKYVAII